MRFIRVFLWGLVAAMTLQGFLHADEYGSAVSFFGGVSLTLSIWKESLWSQVRALVPGVSSTNNSGLPRALVIAALQESARHPGLHTLPALRRALSEHRRSWDAFREEEVQWMLSHADLIGGLRAEGQTLWQPAWSEHAMLEQHRDSLAAQQCSIPLGAVCTSLQKAYKVANEALSVAHYRVRTWERLLTMDASLTLIEWWNATAAQSQQRGLHERVSVFKDALNYLHNVTSTRDARVRFLKGNATAIATDVAGEYVWQQRIVQSLLLRDLWSTCLQHIHQRESRVQEMMVATGVQDLYNTHERLLGAALRSVSAADAPIVQGWFDAIGQHAWWLSEDVPAIVRRCIGQTVGECRRIGPTEITSLIAQFDERAQIVKDWIRCLFIGMWNAMPAVCLLFIVELVVLLIPRRHVYRVITDNSQELAQLAPIQSRRQRRRSHIPRLKSA